MTHMLRKHQTGDFMRPPPTPAAALGIHRDSRTICKTLSSPPGAKQQPPPKIRIIHIFAPEIIKTDVANFRELVQRLTGKPSSSDSLPSTTNKNDMININVKPKYYNERKKLPHTRTELETMNGCNKESIITDHQLHLRSYDYKVDVATKDHHQQQDHDYLQQQQQSDHIWRQGSDHNSRSWFVDPLEGVECFLPADIGDFHFNGIGEQTHHHNQLSYRG